MPLNKSIDESFQYFKTKELDLVASLTNENDMVDYFENSVVEKNGTHYMYWGYTFPKGINWQSPLWKEHTVFYSSNLRGTRLYMLDVIHENIFLRFAYNTFSTNEEEVRELLMNIASGLRFYKGNVDGLKLAERIYEGKAYYEE